VNSAVGTAVVLASLLLAVWSLVAVVRNRPIDVSHLIAMGVVEALVILHIAIAVGRMISGARPHETAVFIGYAIAFVGTLPLAAALARSEPTRWGSVVVTVAAVVLPVLVVRLQQVWGGIG
jgi:hypothetical protein